MSIYAVDSNRISAAFSAWREFRIPEAERLFRQELAENPTSPRALCGLFELLRYRQKSDEANLLLPRITQTPWGSPFLLSAWGTVSSTNQRSQPVPEILAMLEHVANGGGEASGIMPALALEHLGLHALTQGRLSESEAIFSKIGAIEQWAVIGPFDNVSSSGFDKHYPPEATFEQTTYTGRGNLPVKWFEIPAIRRDKWVDFEYYYSVGQDIYYANTFVFAENSQPLQLRVGTSGSVKVLLNDAVIFQDENEKNNGYDTYILPVLLNKGWNRILFKVGSAEITRCNVAARLTTPDGKAATGLRFSATQQNYNRSSSGIVALVENFAVRYFRELLNTDPSDPLATLALAHIYLLNDQHIEAELLLREGLKHWPDAPFFQTLLADCYARSGQQEEFTTLRDLLRKSDSLYVPGMLSGFTDALRNEDYATAESIVQWYRDSYGDTPVSYAMRLQTLAGKNAVDQLISVIEEAYHRFPGSWEFAKAYSDVIHKRTANRDSVLSILRNSLEYTHSALQYFEIGELCLSFSDIAGWESNVKAAIQRQPVACGYYEAVANQYLAMQKPDSALPYIQKALAISPQAARFHRTCARIHRALGNITLAREEFWAAILYNPSDFDTRAELRAFEGKPSIFAGFPQLASDSIIKQAPKENAYPDKDYVILAEEQKRVFYENGAQEYTMEFIVRLFTADAVDQWKEYSLAPDSDDEVATIEKAVSVKQDGTEIVADISGNDIVFKSLEAGDVIQLRWKSRIYYDGKFSRKFWDSFSLNSNVPVHFARYALLVPDNLKFDFRVRNAGIYPVITQTPDGKLIEWTVRNEPPLEEEIAMPSWYEIGKYLEFSNINSWDEIVSWYLELTKQQVKPDREVSQLARSIAATLGPDAGEIDQIRALYEYITKNIRYSSVPFRQAAYIPQKARTVLSTKIGDCKDLTTLFIALAREIGLTAHYMLVNTYEQGYTRQRPLPTPWVFDHCIAAVVTSGGMIYVDLTAPDLAVGSVPEGVVGAFALLIRQGVAEPTTLARALFPPNTLNRSTEIELHEQGNATFTVKSVRSGILAAYLRSNYREQTPKDREKMLSETLSREYQNVTIQSFTFENLDVIQQHLRYSMTYNVGDLMTEAGNYYVLKMPWSDTWKPSPAFTLDKRQYPLDYPVDADTIRETLTIRFPENYTLLETPKSLKKKSDVAEYSVSYSYSKGILNAERVVIQKNGFVEPAKYSEFKAMYNAVAKEDGRQLLLRPTSNDK
jgi:Tfp pilus assembly protein PilF